MILIALSWIILLLFFIPCGIAVKSLLKLKSSGNYIPIFLGLFIQCLGLSICSFFFKIGLEVFIANFLISVVITYWKSKEIKESVKEILFDLRALSTTSKCSLLSIFIFSLFKCSQFPFIVDNESYYLQTIKWINEYGLVKGLGNLHIYFGQTSPFHILQAGFNFNFLTERSNDINGLILNLSSLYFITEFEKRYKINGEIHWIGFILIFNILFFQFISSPSPDLLIFILSQILFYYFMDKEDSLENYKIATLLFLNLLFIKITIAPLILLLFYKMYKSKKRLYFFLTASAIIGAVLCLKNFIITGYPFYPLQILPINRDWTIPEKLLKFVIHITENSGYSKTSDLKNPTILHKLNSWIQLGGINRIFNFGIILLFAVGLVIKRYKNQTKYIFLYLVLALNFLILLFTSPQYRYFLPEFVFLFVVIFSTIFCCFKGSIKTALYSFLIAIVVPLAFTEIIGYPNLTKNRLHQDKESNSWTQILIPKKNSKYAEIAFEKVTEGNLDFNSPKENFFFYGTANGELPCVNKVQVDYLKKKYNFIPQLRTSDLADGFYSKNTAENE
ncbi:LIC_10190 family membrane protein [Flavobacterium nackdongense]|uniref:DUF8201 domain-containing protein n=1 Tax=Flavobacterium nackdongense TaxID=2547394 RepID=A0A4P6YC40_9FLAO|nr:hypothetical protein [Flavobacterium nackdongense]QBN18245.1 hypothetical protein E1750_05295 [Flavobacterium nackdongense]